MGLGRRCGGLSGDIITTTPSPLVYYCVRPSPAAVARIATRFWWRGARSGGQYRHYSVYSAISIVFFMFSRALVYTHHHRGSSLSINDSTDTYTNHWDHYRAVVIMHIQRQNSQCLISSPRVLPENWLSTALQRGIGEIVTENLYTRHFYCMWTVRLVIYLCPLLVSCPSNFEPH